MGKNNLITLGFNNKKYNFALVFRDCINLIRPVKIIKYRCCRYKVNCYIAAPNYDLLIV